MVSSPQSVTAGTAIGSGLVGALTVVMAIPGALALTTTLIVASLPLAVRGGRPPDADRV